MRKSVVRCLVVLSIALVSVALAACAASSGSSGSAVPSGQAGEQKGFTPSLDTATKCSLSVAGSYDNFEALEAEFDKFNEYYPDVELSYTKLDDYNNVVSTALNSEDVAKCMDAGMNGHIAKPIDIKIVMKEIRRVKEGKL